MQSIGWVSASESQAFTSAMGHQSYTSAQQQQQLAGAGAGAGASGTPAVVTPYDYNAAPALPGQSQS